MSSAGFIWNLSHTSIKCIMILKQSNYHANLSADLSVQVRVFSQVSKPLQVHQSVQKFDDAIHSIWKGAISKGKQSFIFFRRHVCVRESTWCLHLHHHMYSLELRLYQVVLHKSKIQQFLKVTWHLPRKPSGKEIHLPSSNVHGLWFNVLSDSGNKLGGIKNLCIWISKNIYIIYHIYYMTK